MGKGEIPFIVMSKTIQVTETNFTQKSEELYEGQERRRKPSRCTTRLGRKNSCNLGLHNVTIHRQQFMCQWKEGFQCSYKRINESSRKLMNRKANKKDPDLIDL